MMSGSGPVLVVGGTGMLGGQVVTELLSRGKRVRALVRPMSDAKRLEQAGAEIARGDIMNAASLLQAMDDADRACAAHYRCCLMARDKENAIGLPPCPK
jgi:uncharacterized protein YbjT (DUF2867 family)